MHTSIPFIGRQSKPCLLLDAVPTLVVALCASIMAEHSFDALDVPAVERALARMQATGIDVEQAPISIPDKLLRDMTYNDWHN